MSARRAARAAPRFDAAYYRRFYLDPDTRVYDQDRHARLVAGVVNLVEWLNGPIHGVLDVGAGVGWWGQWLAKHRPGLAVLSTELEPEVCRKYGHLQADLTEWVLPFQFDLVVCQGVLPYLDDAGAAKALRHLARMCSGFLYLEAITAEDRGSSIDPTRTDLDVHLRPVSWYRHELGKSFREVGAGLWAKKGADVVFYALEAQPPDARPPVKAKRKKKR